jgi:hypothetical protein
VPEPGRPGKGSGSADIVSLPAISSCDSGVAADSSASITVSPRDGIGATAVWKLNVSVQREQVTLLYRRPARLPKTERSPATTV